MSDNGSIEKYMKAVIEKMSRSDTSHPSDTEIIDLFQHNLPDDEAEKIQLHLAQCGDCLDTFKSVNDFFTPSQEVDSKLEDRVVDQAWQRFWQEIQPGETTPSVNNRVKNKANHSPDRWPNRWIAIAASLIIIAALPWLWVISLKQTANNSQNRLIVEQQHLQQQMAQLQEENRQLKLKPNVEPNTASQQELQKLIEQNQELLKRNTEAQQEYQTTLTKLKQPQLNVPIVDLLPENLTVRDGSQNKIKRIVISAKDENVTFILNSADIPERANYRIEIINQEGKSIWQSNSLKRDENGNFPIGLNRSFLTTGRYSFKLFDSASNKSPIGEYKFIIEIK